MAWRLVVWELSWNGLGTGGMGVKLEWPGDDAGYIQNHSLLEKISAHSSRVFAANTAANFVFISGY